MGLLMFLKKTIPTYGFLSLQQSGRLVPVSVYKTHKLLSDKHSVSLLSLVYLFKLGPSFIL